MAWALQFDGVNDYLLVENNFDFTGDFYLKIDADMHKSTTEGFLELSTSTNNFFGKLNNNSWYCRMAGTTTIFNYTLPENGRHTLEYERIGGTLTAKVDGVLTLNTTFTAGSEFNLYGRLQGSGNIAGNLYEMVVTDPNGTYTYDPTTSDHSGTDPQPIVTDTIGGNDATGYNFPANDPSVWINLGGGPTFNPAWAINANKLIGF